jgi:hypothetical protein
VPLSAERYSGLVSLQVRSTFSTVSLLNRYFLSQCVRALTNLPVAPKPSPGAPALSHLRTTHTHLSFCTPQPLIVPPLLCTVLVL